MLSRLGKLSSVAVLFVLILFLIGFPAEAAKISTGDNMTVGPDELIEDDVYMFGDVIKVSGIVTGDAFLFGREVVVDGDIMGSLLVFAENIRIDGNVAGSVRGGANSISFHGSTGRDLMVMGNTLTVAGPVGKDLFAAASTGTLTGSIGRDVITSINRLIPDGPIGGDVSAAVSELVLGPDAQVDGKVTYTSENEATINSQAIVGGSITRLDPPTTQVTAVSAGRKAWSFFRPILSLLVVALLMILLFPGVTKTSAAMIREKPLPSLGVGALIVFVAPIAALILLITVIGIPVSFLSMLLYIVLLYLSRIFAGYFLADLAFEKFDVKLHPVLKALIGVLVLALIFKIPYIGWLVHLAAVIFGSGAFVHYLLNKNEKTAEVLAPAEVETA